MDQGGKGGKEEKEIEANQRKREEIRKKLERRRIMDQEGKGGKEEKEIEANQRKREEIRIKVEVEMGIVRKIHQRRERMQAKGVEKEREEMVGEMEEIMLWQNPLTTSFGVLIFHWSRFWKNV